MGAETPVLEALHRAFLERHPQQAAEEIEDLEPDAAVAILATQPDSILAPLWERLSPDIANELLNRLEAPQAARILNRMDPNHAAGLLGGMRESQREAFLALLDNATQRDLRLILSYPANSAGALMDPRIIYMRRTLTVGEALNRLRSQRRSMRPVRARRILLLVDDEKRLDGMVEIQDLAMADPSDPIGNYAQPAAAWVHATDSKEDIVDRMEHHMLSSLPVLDADGRLIGVVRYEELVAVAREEAVADIQTMFGVSKDERALSPAGLAIRKRLPWLQINLVTAFLAASVVGLFENTIAQFTALAVLLPVVAGQSGNTGAQALAVVIRGLALREIRVTQWLRVVTKELKTGLVNGAAVAVTTALGVFVWSGSAGLTLIIGISMVLSMVIAGMAGAMIPILLTISGQDPAQSSSIILTTITDVAGFFSFLGIATLLIGML